jgi:hypothetical protein
MHVLALVSVGHGVDLVWIVDYCHVTMVLALLWCWWSRTGVTNWYSILSAILALSFSELVFGEVDNVRKGILIHVLLLVDEVVARQSEIVAFKALFLDPPIRMMPVSQIVC